MGETDKEEFVVYELQENYGGIVKSRMFSSKDGMMRYLTSLPFRNKKGKKLISAKSREIIVNGGYSGAFKYEIDNRIGV